MLNKTQTQTLLWTIVLLTNIIGSGTVWVNITIVDITKHTQGITNFEYTHRERHGAIFQMVSHHLYFELFLLITRDVSSRSQPMWVMISPLFKTNTFFSPESRRWTM